MKPYIKFVFFSLVCLSLALAFGCAREEKYIGTYKATEESPAEFRGTWVELKAGGNGIRRVNSEEIIFEWKVKGRELRVHTRAGGVLVGKLRNGILEVSLPGSKILYLKKVE